MRSKINILYEDNHIITVNKKPGDIAQADRTGDVTLPELIKDYLKKKYNKPGEVFLGVVHRIDRPVSGVVIFAKTGKALARLNKLFHDREVKKTYWAVVRNKPKAASGKLVHYLIKNQEKNKSFAYEEEHKDTKKAILDYRILAGSDHYYLLEVNPQTGRHHQIRAQLAAIGCPIKGDVKYGFPRPNKDASIHLHAREIELVHPVKKEPLIVKAQPPDEKLWKFFTDSLQ